ncbi:MAG: KEOPS complex kinase/ATPase Bud32 [Candidatus Aenigmatarchaeota archaeon]
MIIYRGAEAVIRKINENEIIKERIEKKYRIKELDIKIRKERNKREAKILIECKRIGINVPRVLEINDFSMKMEYINGKRLKDVINNKNYKEFATEIGKIVSILHSNNIVHNDLTLSNLLLYDNKIYLIDFGLSYNTNKIEKKAEDILTLYYSAKFIIGEKFEEFFKMFVDVYTKNYSEGGKVIERMKKILSRGRYSLKNNGN